LISLNKPIFWGSWTVLMLL